MKRGKLDVAPALCELWIWLTFHFSYVRKMLLVRAANMALIVSTPSMASVVAFLVYAGSGHQLTPAIIFSSLTWFQLLRLPLMMLRRLLNCGTMLAVR